MTLPPMATKVKRIEANGTVELEAVPPYGLALGSRYIMLNAKSLLDAPMEYFIDARNATLYFIPPDGEDISQPAASQVAIGGEVIFMHAYSIHIDNH
jgi:hypothetical protein